MIPAEPVKSWVEHIMGMPISVLARGPLARAAPTHDSVAAMYAELRTVDATFSTYQSTSEVSRIARNELSLSDASVDVQDVARRCEQARVRTGGLFNAHRPDGSWDPSGLVKGWAVERAFRHLTRVADLDWCVNAGGDVVVSSAEWRSFNIGIQDPDHRNRLISVVCLSSGAVATSGTYARGEHLYDPHSGTPATSSRSVTVTGPSLELADVLATSACVAGPTALDIVQQIQGYEAMRVDRDGLITCTEGWTGSPPEGSPVPTDG